MDLTMLHGWQALAVGYGAVQGPMWLGLAEKHAPLSRYLLSPLVAGPLTAIAGLAVVAANSFIPGMSAVDGVIQWAMGLSLGATLGYIGGQECAGLQPSNRVYQRGTLISEQNPEDSSKLPQRSADRAIRLAGRDVRAEDETKHFKMIGTTGTGKSTAIQEILRSALARGDRAIIADPDEGYTQRFFCAARGDKILNPFDSKSVKWDLFGEINTAYDVDQLARSFIPDHDGADRSWRAYARTFFTAVTRQARDAGIRSVAELYRLLVVAEPKELRTLVEGTPAQPFLDEHNSRMFDSIRSVTASAVAALEYVAEQKATELSVREWVRSESPGVLFMPYKAGQIPALRSIISGWMRLAIFEKMHSGEEGLESNGEKNKPLWFVVDELDALGQIDGLKDALVRLRKFGGRCVLGFQSIAQVSGTYGQSDAHTIVENCSNTLILRCSASEGGGTARFASQLIGDREILRTTLSTSHRDFDQVETHSRSEHFAVEPALMPSQIEQLPDLVGYLKYASEPQWNRVRLVPWAERNIASFFAASRTRVQNKRLSIDGFDYD